MRRRLLPLLVPAVALCTLAVATPAGAAGAPSPAPVVVAPVPPPPVPSQADLDRTQAEIAALSAEVDRTTAELTAGTQRLEDGRARLAQTQASAQQAREQADLALSRAAAAKALLARVVNAAYRAPRPDTIARALAASPDRLSETVLADAELDQVQGRQSDALEDAAAKGRLAEALRSAAETLEQRATDEARDLEAQVAALTASATDTRVRLEGALSRLAAQRLAVADQAARDAAAAQSLVDISGGAALCTGISTAGYPNGFLPPEALCPLVSGGGHRLRADAAAAFNAMYAAHPLCITDSYRSYGAQVDVYARKPGLAAVPGTSNHGLGLAVDLCGGVEVFGSPAHEWMKANAPRYGFIHPAWAEPGGSRPEPWHWEFVGVPPAK